MKIHFAAFLAAVLLLTGCGKQTERAPHDGLRVISMAPNVTEILYALGLSNQVAGVSKFSAYPPEAAEKPCVGGTYDPNWEQIVSLQPDLVIGLDSQKEIAAQLERLNLHFLGVPHEHITEIIQSIRIIGDACGAEEQAQKIVQTLEKKISPAFEGGQTNRPRILMCIGHDARLSRMYIAAKNTFYDELITLAGGINACEQTHIKYPEISPEGLLSMKPDLVIDLVPPIEEIPANYDEIWAPYPAVIMTNQYAFIPGPRFGLLLDDLTEAIQHRKKSKQ